MLRSLGLLPYRGLGDKFQCNGRTPLKERLNKLGRLGPVNDLNSGQETETESVIVMGAAGLLFTIGVWSGRSK